jgi:proline iminopeptidase
LTLYPPVEPFLSGALDVGDGNEIYWEQCGNPSGKPALVLHGGPGSGCTPWFRRLFDPEAYRIVLFDQRNCGRSQPHASDIATDLTFNTTQHLLRDIERLRAALDVERWLVAGGSWGCVLALAYAESHPDRVSELVLFGVTTGRRSELDWLFRGGLARFFPQQWERLARTAGSDDVPEAYSRLLSNSETRRHAAEEWCRWESATPHWPPRDGIDVRFQDPDYAMCFARIVTHYVSHDLFLEDDQILRGAGLLAQIPGVLVHGRFDFQSPLKNAWDLHRAWPESKLVVVDEAGHSAGQPTGDEIVRATDSFR